MSNTFQRIQTGDGSLTFFSEEFGQAFHNVAGAAEEALEKFVLPCRLKELAQQRPELHLLDVCFGLGYNAGVALETIWAVNPECRVHIIGLERSPEVPQEAYQSGVWSGWSFGSDWGLALPAGSLDTQRTQLTLLWGDARQTINQVPLLWADAVFLDPFSPSVCPELWTVEFLAQVARRMHPLARLTTYSCSAAARSALLAAQLVIGSTPPVGRPWPGTVASPTDTTLPPLSPADQEHLLTRAAIPFRDPTLSASREDIVRGRQQEQQKSTLEPTSAWKRRWIKQTHPMQFHQTDP